MLVNLAITFPSDNLLESNIIVAVGATLSILSTWALIIFSFPALSTITKSKHPFSVNV